MQLKGISYGRGSTKDSAKKNRLISEPVGGANSAEGFAQGVDFGMLFTASSPIF